MRARSELNGWWRIGIVVVGAIYHACFRLRFAGTQRIPKSGPAILAANHVSALDGPALALATVTRARRIVRFLVAAEFFQHRWIGPVMRLYRQIRCNGVRATPARSARPWRRSGPGPWPASSPKDASTREPRRDCFVVGRARPTDRARDRGSRGPGGGLGHAAAVAEARSASPTSAGRPCRRGSARRTDPGPGGPGFDRGYRSLHRPRWWMRSLCRWTVPGRSPRRNEVRRRGRRTTPPRARRRVRGHPTPRRGGCPRGRSRAVSRTASEPAPAG